MKKPNSEYFSLVLNNILPCSSWFEVLTHIYHTPNTYHMCFNGMAFSLFT